jgi:hypothetical protein
MLYLQLDPLCQPSSRDFQEGKNEIKMFFIKQKRNETLG